MTQLVRATSEQGATATPSPPAAAFERAAPRTAPAPQPQHPVESPQPAAKPLPQELPLQEAMKRAAEQIDSYLKASGRELRFSVDEATGETVITVRDAVSGDVIRQIPNEEALRLAQALGNQPNVLVDIAV